MTSWVRMPLPTGSALVSSTTSVPLRNIAGPRSDQTAGSAPTGSSLRQHVGILRQVARAVELGSVRQRTGSPADPPAGQTEHNAGPDLSQQLRRRGTAACRTRRPREGCHLLGRIGRLRRPR